MEKANRLNLLDVVVVEVEEEAEEVFISLMRCIIPLRLLAPLSDVTFRSNKLFLRT